MVSVVPKREWAFFLLIHKPVGRIHMGNFRNPAGREQAQQLHAVYLNQARIARLGMFDTFILHRHPTGHQLEQIGGIGKERPGHILTNGQILGLR